MCPPVRMCHTHSCPSHPSFQWDRNFCRVRIVSSHFRKAQHSMDFPRGLLRWPLDHSCDLSLNPIWALSTVCIIHQWSSSLTASKYLDPWSGRMHRPAQNWDYSYLSEHNITGLKLQGTNFQGLFLWEVSNSYSWFPDSVELLKDKWQIWIKPESSQEFNQGQWTMSLPLGVVTWESFGCSKCKDSINLLLSTALCCIFKSAPWGYGATLIHPGKYNSWMQAKKHWSLCNCKWGRGWTRGNSK